jgi:hypothetical protein
LETPTCDDWYEDDDMLVQLEYAYNIVFLHLTYKIKYTKALKNKCKKLLQELKEELVDAGYKHLCAYNKHQDSQWYKFVESMGFSRYITTGGYHVYRTPL